MRREGLRGVYTNNIEQRSLSFPSKVIEWRQDTGSSGKDSV